MNTRASAIVLLTCLLTQTGWGQESQPASQPAKQETTVDWGATLQNAGDLANGALQGAAGIGGWLQSQPWHLRLGADLALNGHDQLHYHHKLLRTYASGQAEIQAAVGMDWRGAIILDAFLNVAPATVVDLMTYPNLHLASGYSWMAGIEVNHNMFRGYKYPMLLVGGYAAFVRHATEIKDLRHSTLAGDGLMLGATGRIRANDVMSFGLNAGVGMEMAHSTLPSGKEFWLPRPIAKIGINLNFEWSNVVRAPQAEAEAPKFVAPPPAPTPPPPPPAKQEERK